MKNNTVKRIPVSYGLSAFMLAFGLFLIHIAKDNISSFSEFFASPINTVFLAGIIFVCMCALFYYEISEDEIRVKVLFFTEPLGKRIPMDNICEIGVTKGDLFRKSEKTKISYFLLRTDENKTEYYFLETPSARLYTYLSENFRLPFTQSTIDSRERVKICSEDANRRAEKNKKTLITVSILAGIFLISILLCTSIYMIFLGLSGKENMWMTLAVAVFIITICYYLSESLYGDLMSRMAEFKFSKNGLLIVYPNNKKVFYAWTDFALVGTCIFRTKSSRGYGHTANYVICFVTHKAKKNKSDRWPVGDCSYKIIPYTQFSAEKYEKLRQYYPGEIAELVYIN